MEQENTAKQTSSSSNGKILYKPSLLSKIVSWIIWFIGSLLIITWLLNFTIPTSENATSYKIILWWFLITIYWILFFLTGCILHTKKYKIHLWISLIYVIIIAISGYFLFSTYWDNDNTISNFNKDSFISVIWIPLIIYFLIQNAWCAIKFMKFKKTGKTSEKVIIEDLESIFDWAIVTLFLYLWLITTIVLGKIEFIKIAQPNESLLNNTEHELQITEEQDWIEKLKNIENQWIDIEFWENLDKVYLSETQWDDYTKEKLGWEWNQYECIKINTWWNEYCWTWARERATIKRMLNRKFNLSNEKGKEDYLSLNWKEVTIYSYIKKQEEQMRKDLKEIDSLLNLNYSLQENNIYTTLTQNIHLINRWSLTALQYYIREKDDEMVKLIIKINKELTNHLYNIGTIIWINIGTAIDYRTDLAVNSLVWLMSNQLREDIIEIYNKYSLREDQIIQKMAQWEYQLWKEAIEEIEKHEPTIYEFLYHFPFYSENDTKKLIYNQYLLIYYNDQNNYDNKMLDWEYNLTYNIIWLNTAWEILPRISNNKLVSNMTKAREILLQNLAAGEYVDQFEKYEWQNNHEQYQKHLIKEY